LLKTYGFNRVNTFRRLDLLEIFLDSHANCDVVEEITVVWSDQLNPAPLDWERKYRADVVKFEVHSADSLNNRFLPLQEIRTNAVLSADDDLSLPCHELDFAMHVWMANQETMVGFSPRLTTRDTDTGRPQYRRWQHTWWNGKYTLMLTKIAIMHKKYLQLFKDEMTPHIIKYIDDHRNCEDLAMSHLVAEHTGLPPVWAEVVIYDTGLTTAGGISSGSGHFDQRGECLDVLQNMTGTWPWVLGLQKAVPIGKYRGDYFGITDFVRLLWSYKR
jgi:hypothetical protein